MKKVLTIICLVLLSSCSQEPEVLTGPFVTRDGIKYDQNTNEPVNGIAIEFYENGQLFERGNYIDDKRDGLLEEFYENGQLSTTVNFIDGKQDGIGTLFRKN